MKTVCLQIEDAFMESFLKMLPSEKVQIVTWEFADDQRKLQEELQNYLSDSAAFTPYYDNMKEIDSWLSEGKRA